MKKIKAIYHWFYMQYIFIAFLFLLMILLPIFVFEREDNQLLLEILWYSICVSFIVMMIIFFLKNYQVAELTEEGITFKSLLGIVKSLKWSEIYNIALETMISGTAGIRFFTKEWIVIYTEPNQYDPYFKPNRKRKKGPWYIAATDENIKVVNEYMKKYLPNVLPIEAE